MMPGLERSSASDGSDAEKSRASGGVVARFYPPAPHLAAFVIDYSIYDSGPAWSCKLQNRYPPGPPNVCMTFDAGRLHARIRRQAHEWQSGSVVFGPTSHAMDVASNGGRLIGFGLTALGWSRLFGRAANRYANRITPLATMVGRVADAALRTALTSAPDDAAIVVALDRFVATHLRVPGLDDATIQGLAAAILDPHVRSVAALVERLDVPDDTLRRIANRHFGFPPKLLLRRVRFMRALMAMAESGANTIDFAVTAPGYHDQSHFIRDARLFLGMTGRQFLHDITPIMEAMREGRRARFGKPLQGLIAPGRDNLAKVAAA